MLLEPDGQRHELPETFFAGVRHPLTRGEVMTAQEVSDLLRLPLSTVYELARKGQLPATRFGRTWRFLRTRIEELLSN